MKISHAHCSESDDLISFLQVVSRFDQQQKHRLCLFPAQINELSGRMKSSSSFKGIRFEKAALFVIWRRSHFIKAADENSQQQIASSPSDCRLVYQL